MIQSKIVTIISLCTLSLSILCTNPIKAEALTQKNAKEMISGIRPLEGEIRNPDISLSDDELNAKYEGRIYREIEKNYVIKGYPKDELEMVTEKIFCTGSYMPKAGTNLTKPRCMSAPLY